MSELDYRDGNYFWDSQNKVLVKYGDDTIPSIVVNPNVAFPIPITDELLKLLGFSKMSGNYVYKDNKDIIIVVDGASEIGFYTFDNKSVAYLHELQNAFTDKNLDLDIDVEKLLSFLKEVILIDFLRQCGFRKVSDNQFELKLAKYTIDACVDGKGVVFDINMKNGGSLCTIKQDDLTDIANAFNALIEKLLSKWD